MSYSRKLLYPQDEDLNSQFSKNYEYIILWMLNQNEYCQWADFVQGNIKESTLSGYLNKLLDRKFIVKPKRNHYEITKKGKDRLNELITIKESGSSLIYPPKAILRKRNYDHWILWMLNNNDFCKWSDFTDDQSPVRINQSSLSKNLNSLMDDGYIINENKEYKITPRGKSEYLKVLKLYELDRQSILDEESKRIEEITEKTSMFFEKYDITDNKLKFRFLNNVLQLDYEKISGEKGLLSEENYNKIIFFLAYNHPDQYPEHNNVEEFSRLYEIDSRDLDYYLKEIVENESFGKKIFKIEDEFGRTYYFQSDDKLEKILRTIVEEHITMANYLRSFQNGEKDETISLRLADVIEEILNDICPNLFHESLKEALRYFLPEYIQYLAYKLESEEKLTDQAGKIKNVAFRTVSSIIQGFDSVLSTNGKNELEENFFSLDYAIFETLPIYFMSKLFFIRTEEFKRNFFKKHKKLLERIEEYLSLEKLSKLEQEIKEQKSILSILDNLILKDIIACLNHKFDISINLTDEIIEKFPESYIGYLFQSITLMEMNRNAEALEMIEKGLSLFSDNISLHVHYIQLSVKLDDFDQAIELIEKLETEYPHNPYILHAKCLVHLSSSETLWNHPELIDSTIESALKLQPNNPELLILKAVGLCKTKNFKEAKSFLKKNVPFNIWNKNPRIDTSSFFTLAFSYIARNKIDKATQIANEVLRFFPNHPTACLTNAIILGYDLIYKFNPDTSEAEDSDELFLGILARLFSIDTNHYNHMRYIQLKSIVLNATKGFREAIKLLEEAIKITPYKTDLYYLRLNLLISNDTGDHVLDSEALDYLDNIIDILPGKKKVFYPWKTYVLWKAKKFKEGLDLTNYLVENDICECNMLNNKAIFLANLGRKNEAIDTIELLLSSEDPKNHGNIYDSYGEILMMFGDYKEAIVVFKKALEIVKKDPSKGWFICETYLKMGKSYIELGQYEKALEFIEKGKDVTEKTLPEHRAHYNYKSEELFAQINELTSK